jgi:hypothetical protein
MAIAVQSLLKKSIKLMRSLLIWFVTPAMLLAILALAWLRWDAGLSRDDWYVSRHGQLENTLTDQSITVHEQLSESVRLRSSSGLQVSFRVIRDDEIEGPIPVLLILGGHRTGSNAVELFGKVGRQAIVGVDYPYDGPASAKGVLPIAKMIPLARRALLDTIPAISLVLDWLMQQPWVKKSEIIVVGASLGVPFAASATARDPRISAVMLVHGAADNRLWLEAQIARRVDPELLHYPLATLVHWLAYGPIFDTSKHVAAVSPRPVLIIGAIDDERTPAGQTELLYEAASEPKRLRWTEGQHIQPNRTDVIETLLQIANEELPFLRQ